MKRRALWFWTWTVVLVSAVLVAMDPAMLILGRPSMLDPQIIAGVLAIGAGTLQSCFSVAPNL